jgi:signal transduction histidine kinase/ligand-binding sensor domain-containing protein
MYFVPCADSRKSTKFRKKSYERQYLVNLYRGLVKPFLLILFLLLALAGKGQRYHFEKITEQHGLSDNRVTCFLKDREGFMWIGTANGLNRYDGYEFRVYGPGRDHHRLSHEHINHIEQDHRGRLWIATWGGLNVLDPATDSLQIFLPDHAPLKQKKTKIASSLIWDTYIDPQERVWLALDSRDLCYYNQATGEFHYYPWRDFVSKNLATAPPDPYNAIHRIVPKSDHELWLGTTRGLFSFDLRQETFTYYGGDNRASVTFLSYDSLQKQVCFGQRGMYVYHENRRELRRLQPSKAERSSITSALPMAPDLAGLWEIDIPAGVAYPVKLPGLDTYAQEAAVTNIGNHYNTEWIGTSNGVYLYNASLDRFRYTAVFPDTTHEATGVVYHVLDHEAKKRYYASSSAQHRLIVIDKSTGARQAITHIAGKPLLHCSRTYEDSRGRLWILTERRLFVSDENHGHFTVFPYPLKEEPYYFNDMAEDALGNFWFSSLAFGIFHYDVQTHRWTAMLEKPVDLFSVRPTNLQSDTARGTVWISDFGYGLFRYDLASQTFINYGANTDDRSSLQSALANDMTIDPKGDLWIGTTSGGVSHYSEQSKKFTTFSMQTGLPENTIPAVQTDRHGNIWLASQKGITCLKPSGQVLKHFDKGNGLPFSGFSTPWSINARGELLIGAGAGFLKFHPDSLATITTEFPVRITSAYVSGHSLLEDGAHGYDYKENEFTAQFAALSYLMPGKNKLFYQLEGFDKAWIAATDKPMVHYTNLAHGSYLFKVRATDYTGRPSANIATVSFMIRAPFWKRWWFIALLITAGVSLLILWTRILQRRIRSQQILNQVATSLYNQSTYEEVFWMVARSCIDLLHFEDCVIYLVQEERGVLIQKAAGGPKSREPFQIHNPIEIPIGQGIVGTVAVTGKSEIVNNTRKDRRYILDDQQRHAEISVPIIVDGKVFGVIDSEHSRKNFYRRWHLKMLQSISAICSAKISRYFVEDQIRSKVARDLHDDMGSALSSINIMSKIALERGDLTLSGNYLKAIRESTSLMQERLSDMVWAINPKNDTMERVVARMKEFAAEILEPLDIQYEFTETGDFNLTKMGINTRKDFYLILKEALNNAAKYSHCKHISVHLTYLSNAVKLKIEDDGLGFDPAHALGGNGLSNMKHRARSIHAELRIDSAPGRGSVISLTLPYR